MLQIIIAIVYITFICWNWGQAGFKLINRWTGESTGTSLPICSLFGLALIGIVFQLFSIFIPMGGWLAQVLLLLPVLILQLLHRKNTVAAFHSLKDSITGLNLPATLFLTAG